MIYTESHYSTSFNAKWSKGIHSELARFYKSLLPKPATTVTFFDRGDFHSIIGQDAVFVSKEILHRSSSELKTSANDPVEYVNVNKVQFEVVLKELLLVHMYRVEVYDCKSWKVLYKGSPGNISQFEDVLFSHCTDTSQSFGVAAVTVSHTDNNISVALALADQTSRVMTVSEFLDNDRYSSLEAALVQLNPKECLIASGETTPQVVRDVLQHTNCLITEKRKGEFSTKNTAQDLQRLLKLKPDTTVEALPEMEKKSALSCLSVLISYLEFMSDEANFGVYHLTTFDLSQYMKLDSAAAKSLNLMPKPTDNREMSLLKVLDNCKTSQGHRLIKQWIRQPLIDVNKIEERLNLVEIFVDDCMLRQRIHEENLTSLPDFLKLAKKLSLNKATLQDCYRVYQGLARLPYLDTILDEYEGEHSKLLRDVFSAELKELMLDLSKFSALLDEVLDMNTVDTMEFLIKPDFDEQLAEIRERMQTLEDSMSKQLNKAAAELSLEPGKTLKLETNSQLGYYLRLTRKDEKVLRNNKNYETLDTKKDGVRFTSRSLSKLNSEHSELKKSYQQLQNNVVSEIMKVAGGYAEPVYRLGDLIAQIDVIISLAIASSNAPIPYIRPKIYPMGTGITELTEVRHPCLEAMDIDYIPNDCTFDKHQSMFHIITGPNMGGKSTYIRSVAISVLMAQIGCFVPCSSASVTVVDSIMCRVGAGDSQLKGVSTFMAEMLESSAILKAATESSMIIIDELGRGTSTYDGFGLAWAISYHIATEIRCFTLFATHFHELTALEDEIEHVTNVHVSALTDNGEMTLLYKVQPGVCDESFGLHVARIVSFPQRVLDHAEKKALELEDTGTQKHSVITTSQTTASKEDDPNLPTSEEKQARKRYREESHDILADFVKRLKSASAESDKSAAESAIDKLRGEITQSNNPFIRSLLNV